VRRRGFVVKHFVPARDWRVVARFGISVFVLWQYRMLERWRDAHGGLGVLSVSLEGSASVADGPGWGETIASSGDMA
jgi:hypothetical protein